MPEREISPAFIKAEKQIPPMWFENRILLYGSLGTFIYTGIEMWNRVPDSDRLLFRMFAAGVFIAGSILDVDSTVKGFDRFRELKKKGIKHPIYETNPRLSKIPERKELMNHKKFMVDYAVSGVSVLVPQLGLGWGLFRALAALNNYRKSERLDRTLEIAASEKALKARKTKK